MSNFTINYKIIDNYKYFKSFPKMWIDDESLYNIGPRYCDNCRYYGSIYNIFIGYCLNCANIFNGKRGNGMSGNEIINNSIDFNFDKCPYMSLQEQIELKKFILEKSIDNIEFPPPPVLSRSFASDIIYHDEKNWYNNYTRNEWEEYNNCECLDRPDSIS